ncbi:hypothetical protein [Streptomyces sp. NL15-2K]|uniref:hypothetical protein n=1 Tax=Streptomyces sp. NL15-2K TaxID=376149 RepID=UPI000F57BCA7|nr:MULTISPECIES: hypothetical protein [Actinomycetes]WKX10541.1 hypothetical protein Q4V64_24740 [Kutzneria buriramensis]
MENESNLSIILITMDRAAACTVFTRSDGKEARLPLDPSPFEDTSVLARLDFTPAYGALLATTLSGDQVLFEMPLEGAGDQLAGRLVVYLDQNQWSLLSNADRGAEKSSAVDRVAARKLKEWVDQRRIILPASAGHYFETGKRFSTDKRYDLGLTVLQYSRGWQMRDPLQVRRNELHDAFCHRMDRPGRVRSAPVFTLDPDALYAPTRWAGVERTPTPQNRLAFQTKALLTASVSIDAMLDTQRVEEGPDTGWMAASQRFSDWLDELDQDSQQKRRAIDIHIVKDLQQELAEEAAAADVPKELFRQWGFKGWVRAIGGAPAVGLFREMLQSRHLNKGTTWRHNDLTDIVYLSCAAGYADFVVCEKHMRDPLQHGLKRMGRSAQVYRRLTDAVAAIEELLEAHSSPASPAQ